MSIVPYQPGVPATPSGEELDLIMRQADLLARSSIVPRDYQSKPGNIVAAALMGRSFGWDAMTAMRLITVIQGTASIKPEAMLALIRSRGHSVEITRHADHVVAKGTRCDNGDTDVQRFSLDDARRAGLDRNGTWKQYPLDMCQWRAVSRLSRSLFSDVVLGAGYTPEEIGIARGQEHVVVADDYTRPAAIEAGVSRDEVFADVNEFKRQLFGLYVAAGFDNDTCRTAARDTWVGAGLPLEGKAPLGAMEDLINEVTVELRKNADPIFEAEVVETEVVVATVEPEPVFEDPFVIDAWNSTDVGPADEGDFWGGNNYSKPASGDISEPQRKMVFRLKKKIGLNDAQWVELLEARHQVTSEDALSKRDASALISHLKELAGEGEDK